MGNVGRQGKSVWGEGGRKAKTAPYLQRKRSAQGKGYVRLRLALRKGETMFFAHGKRGPTTTGKE